MSKRPAASNAGAQHDDDWATQRAKAMDPATPPKTLHALRRNPELAPLVASNPNAPVALLLALAADYPREFLDNPALPFLLLEAPALPLELSVKAVAQVLRFEDVPLAILKQLGAASDSYIVELCNTHVVIAGECADTASASDSHAYEAQIVHEAQNALARHIRQSAGRQTDWLYLPQLYPQWFLRLLAVDPQSRAAVALCPDAPDTLRASAPPQRHAGRANAPTPETYTQATPSYTHDDYIALAEDPRFEVRIALARRADTPAEARAILAGDSDYRTRHAVAIHTRTSPQLLEVMASDGSARVRYGVALNFNTPPRVLEQLSRDSDHQVRAMVARNPSTPQHVLETLLRDDDHVRVSLARNPACPERLLLRLLRDRSDDTRAAALRRINPAAPGLDLTATLEDERLRAVVATNPRLPASALAQLVQQLDPALQGRYDRQLALALAGNPATPTDALDALARVHDKETQTLVARHVRTAPQTLEWLCANVHGNSMMSLCLVGNPATPDQALEQLAATDDYDVVQALLERLKIPPDRRAHIYRRLLRFNLGAQGLPFDLIRYDTTRPLTMEGANAFLRLAALASPLLDEDDYAQGVVSPVWLERYVLALNPAAPRALLAALTHDGNRYVRAAARATLAARAATPQPSAATMISQPEEGA